MSKSGRIKRAALSKAPREPWRIGAWVGNDDFGAVADRLESVEHWWDRSIPMVVRRMFLLFVAAACRDVETANAAAYHGDIDGDFGYL